MYALPIVNVVSQRIEEELVSEKRETGFSNEWVVITTIEMSKLLTRHGRIHCIYHVKYHALLPVSAAASNKWEAYGML